MKTTRTAHDVVDHLLGDLEAAIMRDMWRRRESGAGAVTVRQILDALVATDRKLAYTTVMTVMSRLAEKGILSRERRGKLHVYRATATEAEFVRRIAAQRVQALVSEFGDVAIAQFVTEVTDLSPERRHQLAQLASRRDA